MDASEKRVGGQKKRGRTDGGLKGVHSSGGPKRKMNKGNFTGKKRNKHLLRKAVETGNSTSRKKTFLNRARREEEKTVATAVMTAFMRRDAYGNYGVYQAKTCKSSGRIKSHSGRKKGRKDNVLGKSIKKIGSHGEEKDEKVERGTGFGSQRKKKSPGVGTDLQGRLPLSKIAWKEPENVRIQSIQKQSLDYHGEKKKYRPKLGGGGINKGMRARGEVSCFTPHQKK